MVNKRDQAPFKVPIKKKNDFQSQGEMFLKYDTFG